MKNHCNLVIMITIYLLLFYFLIFIVVDSKSRKRGTDAILDNVVSFLIRMTVVQHADSRADPRSSNVSYNNTKICLKLN